MNAQALLAEMVGTFIFLSCVLCTTSNSSESSYFLAPIVIMFGIVAGLYISSKISGGHLNPAISIMLYFKGGIPLMTTVGYIISQVIGGLLALLVHTFLIS
jgi:glycerol uptake facilitator-like aquaporin